MPEKQYKQKRKACQVAKPKARLPWPAALGLGALAAGAGLALGTLAYAYLATHPPRKRVRKRPTDYGMPFESVRFPSHSGRSLSGWYVPAPAEARAVVVFCHGYPRNREEMLPYAEILHRAGYAALLFDFRAMGESEGDLSSIGYHEVEDVRGALDYLESRPDTADLRVGGLGLSLGAAVAVMTAAQDTRIRAVVAEAPYATLHKALDARFRVVMGPLGPQVARPVLWWAKRWVQAEAKDVAPLAVVGQIGPRALLLIQGKRDLLVPWQDAVALYEAAQEPRELWLLERSGHAHCLRDAPEEYARRITAFFNRYLGEHSAA
ncbi:MAG TPA: alpha/beta hydrolase [Chthonomonadaceae bacterium]|nr:alpha/beta hydrolase [Chthonomonadaceae bacterium]